MRDYYIIQNIGVDLTLYVFIGIILIVLLFILGMHQRIKLSDIGHPKRMWHWISISDWISGRAIIQSDIFPLTVVNSPKFFKKKGKSSDNNWSTVEQDIVCNTVLTV